MKIQIAKNIQYCEDYKTGGLLPDIRTFYKFALNYIARYWSKDRQIASRK